MRSRSRGVFTLADFALAISSTLRLRLAGLGGDQIWYQRLSAAPQYPMAQSGSASVTAVKAFSDSRYQNECRSATARSNGFCTAGLQETGNETWPIFSVPFGCAPAEPTVTTSTTATRASTRRFMTIPPSATGVGTVGHAARERNRP